MSGTAIAFEKPLTTLAAEMLKRIEAFLAKYATSNCWIRRVSGGAQYVTEDVTTIGP